MKPANKLLLFFHILQLAKAEDQLSPRISDGIVATPGEFHSIVALRGLIYADEYCSGIIIDKEWVLTVASCLETLRTGTLFIGGEHELNVTEGNEQRAWIAAAITHPNRTVESSRFVRNDLVLCKVSPPFIFNDYVKAAVLPSNESMAATSEHIIAGWGLTYFDGNNNYTETNLLHKATLQQLDPIICSQSYPNKVDENMMCSGQLSAPTSGSCWGDTGGPVLCFDGSVHYVCGILSREDSGPCSVGKPTLSIRLFPHVNWIRETIDNYEGTVEHSWSESINVCGGILVGSAGRISYKMDQSYEANERCVWTIRPTPSNDINYKLEGYGLSYPDWLGIARIFDSSGIIYDSQKLEPGWLTGSTGEIYFLTFYSFGNSSGGTGFSFIYESKLELRNSSLVHNHGVIEDEMEVEYPEEEWNYAPNELSTWIFNAGEQVAVVNVTRIDIYGDVGICQRKDVLRFYVLRNNAVYSIWDDFCGHFNPGRVLRGGEGVVLAIFKSDGEDEGTGFSLEFKKEDQPIPTTTTTSEPSSISTIITTSTHSTSTVYFTTEVGTISTQQATISSSPVPSSASTNYTTSENPQTSKITEEASISTERRQSTETVAISPTTEMLTNGAIQACLIECFLVFGCLVMTVSVLR